MPFHGVYIGDVGDFLPDWKVYIPGDTTPYSQGTEDLTPHIVKLAP
jgi:hypothetical protein